MDKKGQLWYFILQTVVKGQKFETLKNENVQKIPFPCPPQVKLGPDLVYYYVNRMTGNDQYTRSDLGSQENSPHEI